MSLYDFDCCVCEKPLPVSHDDDRLRKRFFDKVATGNGCWQWQGATNNGYGWFNRGTSRATSKPDYAHRVAFELLVGPIPDGLDVDHLCRNRLCCNPTHLEPVTHAENVRRAFESQETCRNGHPRTSENAYYWRGHRFCTLCRADRNERKRAKAAQR